MLVDRDVYDMLGISKREIIDLAKRQPASVDLAVRQAHAALPARLEKQSAGLDLVSLIRFAEVHLPSPSVALPVVGATGAMFQGSLSLSARRPR